ncbi:MAG: elongation factor Ts, partial [Spirochaetales bacterium]|nr:elongation factor Ts [Spirochaetales bacterium]
MAVSMQQVKELRDLTNAGMLDCKKALEASNGNIDEAMKILKEKGLADAKKRSDRETKEGGVYVGTKDGKVAIALVACETDFVANNAQFKDACN